MSWFSDAADSLAGYKESGRNGGKGKDSRFPYNLDINRADETEKSCHWFFDKPAECNDTEWYQSKSYKCVNCLDQAIFDYAYISPTEKVTDPLTGEMKVRQSPWNKTLKSLQSPMDVAMENIQVRLFPTIAMYANVYAFAVGIVTLGRIPPPRLIDRICTDLVGFGNGLFPRMIFATVFSYLVEGLIKHTYFRHRPNMTTGAVADVDRWMGVNDFVNKDYESYDFFHRSKGAFMGLKSHRSSFPSGHNTGAWTLVGVLLFTGFYNDFTGVKRGWNGILSVMLGIALILGIYQIYARTSLGGWHWPSDILGGVLLGFASAFFGGLFYKYPLLLLGLMALILALVAYAVYKMYEAGTEIVGSEYDTYFYGVVLLVVFGAYKLFSMATSEQKIGPKTYIFICLQGVAFVTVVGFILGFVFIEDVVFPVGTAWRLDKGPEEAKVLEPNSRDSWFSGWTRQYVPASLSLRNLDNLIPDSARTSTFACPAKTGDDIYASGVVASLHPGMYHENGLSHKEQVRRKCNEEAIENIEFLKSLLQISEATEEITEGPKDPMAGFKSLAMPMIVLIFVLGSPFCWKLLYVLQGVFVNPHIDADYEYEKYSYLNPVGKLLNDKKPTGHNSTSKPERGSWLDKAARNS